MGLYHDHTTSRGDRAGGGTAYDIIYMAKTESLLKDHITAVVYLLENLGFVINHPKP